MERNDCFLRDGCVVVDLLNEQDLRVLREESERLLRPGRPGFDSTILSADTEYRKAVDVSIRRCIAPSVDSLLTDYRIAFCTFVVKDARSDQSTVPMHQDWSFVDELRFISIGLWCPLIDVDLENGCLQVVRGSHAFAYPPRAACTPFAYPQLIPYLQENCLHSLPIKAGQALLFDQRLFHCSPPNRGIQLRVAATAVLVPSKSKLRYYHAANLREPDRIEVFEVEDSFYLSHIPGRRPENGISLGVLDINTSVPIDPVPSAGPPSR
jgi:ectoine hydroxylase-related dioxygenase (phytanoyl-CoA dioxygenase family)